MSDPAAAQPVRAAHRRQRVLPVLLAAPGAEHASRVSPAAGPWPAPVQRRPRTAPWLEHRQVEVDVITDDDLHTRGAAALSPYRVILTGSHPEYTCTQMLDCLDSYLATGGRMVYLGGNGFYWVTTVPAADPIHRGPARAGLDPGVGVRTRRVAPGHDGRARRPVAAPRPQPAVADRGRVLPPRVSTCPCPTASWPARGRSRPPSSSKASTRRAPLGGSGSVLGGRPDSRSTGPTRLWAPRRARW